MAVRPSPGAAALVKAVGIDSLFVPKPGRAYLFLAWSHIRAIHFGHVSAWSPFLDAYINSAVALFNFVITSTNRTSYASKAATNIQNNKELGIKIKHNNKKQQVCCNRKTHTNRKISQGFVWELKYELVARFFSRGRFLFPCLRLLSGAIL